MPKPTALTRLRCRLGILSSLALLGACVGPAPVEDYTLARAAYNAAQEAEAVRYAPTLWYKAEEAYKQAENSFKDRDYENSQRRFVEARSLLERSETAARIARVQSGGVPQ